MSRMIYRFVGTTCTIGDTRLEHLGARIELTPHQAVEAVEGGAQLLPAPVFERIFPHEDVSRYASPSARVHAPEEFQGRLRHAWGMVHAWRETGMVPTVEVEE